MTQDLTARVKSHLKQSIAAKSHVLENNLTPLLQAAEIVSDAFRSGKKLLLCGNGGSAADCQHVAAEFVSRLSKDRERKALPAIALTTDSSFLTAYSNDYSFDGVFSRQIEALGLAGDVLIAISTGGGSKNILRAVEEASKRSMKTIALCGESGVLKDKVTLALCAPSKNTQVIQEVHLTFEHILCDLVEETLFGG
jgi:D-sedoheptulose 7-phosphate isomerase